MDIKLFTDFYDALRRVIADLKAIVNLPQAQRDNYRQVITETFLFLNTTLTMVIYQLGDIMELEDDHTFLNDVRQLDNYQEWTQRERNFRLCSNLRRAYREAQTLPGRLAGGVSISDWDTLLDEMDYCFGPEEDVGRYIGRQLSRLASLAREANGTPLRDTQTIPAIREQIVTVRKTLMDQREEFVHLEHSFYDAI